MNWLSTRDDAADVLHVQMGITKAAVTIVDKRIATIIKSTLLRTNHGVSEKSGIASMTYLVSDGLPIHYSHPNIASR